MKKSVIVSVTLTIALFLIFFGYVFVTGRIWDSRTNLAKENRCELSNPYADGFSTPSYECEGNKELETRINQSFDRHAFNDGLFLLISIPSLIIITTISVTIGLIWGIQFCRKLFF